VHTPPLSTLSPYTTLFRSERLLQSQVFAAKNIALADASALACQQMTHSGIFNRHKIQAGVHVSGHAAVQEINDDPARWRGLGIAGADRRSRIHDDDRQPRSCRLPGLLLGEPFRTLVISNHL